MISIVNVAKSIIIRNDGKMLLLTRSDTDSHAPFRYDLPGGGVELHEDFAAAASRETQEETGIEIHADEFELVFTGTSISSSGTESINRMLFMARTETNSVVLSHEHSSYIWVTIEEAIKRFDHPIYGNGMKHVMNHGL